MGTETFAVQVHEKCELDPANGLVFLAAKLPRRTDALQTPMQMQEGLYCHSQHLEGLDVPQVSHCPGNKLEAEVSMRSMLVLALIVHLGKQDRRHLNRYGAGRSPSLETVTNEEHKALSNLV